MKNRRPPIEVAPQTNQETPVIEQQKRFAGGREAVLSSLKHVRNKMSLAQAKALLDLNQKDGFDCPGCAWPDPDDRRSINEYCENGVKAVAEEATKFQIGTSLFKKHSIQALSKKSDFEIGQMGRLTEPMYLARESSHYEPISWSKAFALISKRLCALSSPNEAVFYTSGRTSNEAAFFVSAFRSNVGNEQFTRLF